MEKAALLLTGGTIGASVRDSALRAEEKTELLLLKKYREKGGRLLFDTFRAETMLSENFSEQTMMNIARKIAALDGKGYRAAVVAIGSDNLCNFSVLLAFLLRDMKTPVFLISSQFVLTDERENGSDNLLAVDAAIRRLPRGVYVLNRNLGDDFVSVHAAARMDRCLAPSGDFFSVSGLLAKIKNGRFRTCEPVFSEITSFYQGLGEAETPIFIPKKLGNVAVFSVNPFSPPSFPVSKPDAVFLNLYHSGTAAIKGDASVLPFLKTCAENAVPVYAAPAFFDTIPYETTVQLLRFGVRFLKKTPPVAAEIKTRFLYSPEFTASDRERYFEKNLAGEVLDCGAERVPTKI